MELETIFLLVGCGILYLLYGLERRVCSFENRIVFIMNTQNQLLRASMEVDEEIEVEFFPDDEEDDDAETA
jgi:hypothetical protein